MFEALGGYRVVIVTGPNRAGTTPAARAVSYDTTLSYIDEDDYGCDLDTWQQIVEKGRGVVVHSPGMARWVAEVANREDVFVIWMLRPLSQIMISESRVDWSDSDEREKYTDTTGYGKMRQYPISVVKTRFWQEHQRGLVRHWREVRYEELRVHPLWVPDNKRRNFGPRQWAVKEMVLE